MTKFDSTCAINKTLYLALNKIILKEGGEIWTLGGGGGGISQAPLNESLKDIKIIVYTFFNVALSTTNQV